MKFQLKAFIALTALLFSMSNIQAQRYLNEEFSTITGLPVNIHWSASLIASTGHYMTVGNTYTTGQSSNVLFTKQSPDGTIIWQVEYDNADNLEDYGIGLLEDGNGDFYVIGTSYLSASASLDISVLKYNAAGQLQWDYFFNGSASGDDIPTSAAMEQSNVVITGGTVSTTTQSDYVTIKLKSDGTHLWTSLYDYNQLNDGAAKVSVDQSGNILVVGGSASQINLYDAAILKYDVNGNQVNEHRSNYNVGIDEPTSFGIDGNGNILIGGHYLPSGQSDLELSLISLDDTLGYNWHVNTNPSQGEDMIMDMVVDANGEIYVTGHMEESPSYFKLYVARFNSSGGLDWEATYESKAGGAFGKRITMDAQGDLNIVGMVYSDSDTNIVTLQYDQDGSLLFSKEHDAGGTEIASNVDTDNWGNIYVHGTTSINSQSYVTVKYATFQRDLSAVDSGDYKFVDNEVLVQFKPSVTLNSPYSTRGTTFGILSSFIDQSAIDQINEAFDWQYDFGRFNVVKVFPRLTNTDTATYTRQGEIVKIHHFWSTLVLIIPESLSEYEVAYALNGLTQTVAHAEYNLIGEPFSEPNDPVYQNGLQEGLESSNNPDHDMEMERAWAVYTGTAHARVGIYDSGIEFKHEDFSKTGQETYADSKIEGGFDYTNNTPVPSGNGDDHGHGTQTAGLAGAIRNNDLGVASVAGGDAEVDNFGCQLVDMKIFSDSTGIVISRAADAMVMGALDWNEGGFSLDVLNHSWGLVNSHDSFTQGYQNLFFETNKMVYDAGAVNVCARGNENNENPVIPVTIGPDHFLISVGSSDLDGNKNSTSNFGLNMDIIAPGFGNMVHSTYLGSTYYQHTGTSAAAPLVTGTAALLVGQANDPARWIPGPGLYPDDVENLIQLYPSDIDTSVGYTYTNQNGWGRLNAGLVMEHMAWPHYYVKPFNGSTTSYTATQVQSSVSLGLTEDIGTVTEGSYIGDVFKIEMVITHNIGSDSLLNGWIRNGAANSTLLSSDMQIANVPMAQLDSFNQTQAFISGFIFRLNTDGQGNPVNQWVPVSNTDPISYGYSLHIYDSLATGIEHDEESGGNLALYVWPNPTKGEQTLRLPKRDNLTLDLYDLHGRHLEVVFKGSGTGKQLVTYDVSRLPSGLYFYKLSTPDEAPLVYKFIKQ